MPIHFDNKTQITLKYFECWAKKYIFTANFAFFYCILIEMVAFEISHLLFICSCPLRDEQFPWRYSGCLGRSCQVPGRSRGNYDASYRYHYGNKKLDKIKPTDNIDLVGFVLNIKSISIKDYKREKKSATEEKKEQQKLWTWNWTPNLLNLNAGWLTGEGGGGLVNPCKAWVPPPSLSCFSIFRCYCL